MNNRLYKIGEVCKMLDLPASTLRYWENQFKQFKQLRPIKSTGGQRFYNNNHICILEQLKNILYNEGYTIEGAKKHLKEMLQQNKEAYNLNIENNKNKLNKVGYIDKETLKKELQEILNMLQ